MAGERTEQATPKRRGEAREKGQVLKSTEVNTAAILIGGLAVGVPFLRARIPEVFLYSFCCVSAVVLRAGIDLAVRMVMLGARAFAGGHILISPLSRSPAGVVR